MNTFLKTGKLSGPSKSTSTQISEKKDAAAARHALTPWVEKYRPKTMDEVAYQDEIVSVLKKSLQGADLPNLLFYGPPGTGKTSTILAAARELFGDLYRERVLELNASDERGIQVIREKVKTFAQRTVSAQRPDGKPCPPFKIIILDEADSMTGAAQAALRRTMERETKSTRFCLIGNYVSRIIEPITSRCSKFRFKPLARGILIKRLEEICQKEGVKCDSDALDTLVETSDGDLRRAITFLQSASSLKTHSTITIEDINEITGRVPLHWLDGLSEVCQTGVYDQVESYLSRFLMEGFSASQLLYQLHDRVVFSGELSDHQKSAIAEKIAVCEHRLTEGADEYLQLMDLCCTVMKNSIP